MNVELHRKVLDLSLLVSSLMVICSLLSGQSGSKGNTFIHATKEMTILGAHNFSSGGSGLLPGIVGTKRNPQTFLSFSGYASVSGASDAAHVDGYVKNYNIPVFTFPIGDNGIYAPVSINSTTLSSPVNAAYFRSDPNSAVTSSLLGGNEIPLPFGAPFSTSSFGPGIYKVSSLEYWDINGEAQVKITLQWSSTSAINTLTQNNLSALRIVGWDGSKWVVIPSTTDVGSDMISGKITTNIALSPNQYNVYTFASSDCMNKPILTLGEVSCSGSVYSIKFITNGAVITTSAGIVSGNTVSDIPLSTDVTITAKNSTGCPQSATVLGPKSCPENCILPQLSVGQAICTGLGSYSVSFTETTGATLQINAGTRSVNSILNIPLGTSLVITAKKGSCEVGYIVSSPSGCDNPCANPRISLSGPVCSSDIGTYRINYISAQNTSVQANAGIVNAGYIDHIPVGIPVNITSIHPQCQDETITVLPLSCPNISAIGDLVWQDMNGDGQQNPGEPGISGVQVNLYRANGAYVNTSYSDANGKYLFENLYPDNYYLEFITPSGLERTFPNAGNPNTDSDVTGINGPGTTAVFFVGLGERNMSQDAGYYRCVPTGNLVWYDINKNDIWDTNENGINGIRVNLWRNHFGIWMVWDYKYTGQKPGSPSDDGYYNFCAPPGEYLIEVIMPPLGLVRVRPRIGGDRTIDSDINSDGKTDVFQLASGQSKTDIGAGFYPMAMAGNFVWRDDNFNGIQDPNEASVAGVKVEAISLATGTVFRTDYTGPDGVYTIDYLEKQDYYIKFSPPAGFAATIPRASTDDIDSDVDHSYGPNTTRSFIFEPGEFNNNIDMGLISGILPVTWLDLSAKRVDNKHIISWRTAREVNTSHYIVERNLDGVNSFAAISGIVSAKGNSNDVNSYELSDYDADKAATYLYRIKQVDMDGKFTYSNTVKLVYLGDYSIDMYPNPARIQTQLQILLSHDASVKIELYDSASKLIRVFRNNEVQRAGDKIYPLNLEDIPPGTYSINIYLDDLTFTKKLIRIE